MLSSTLVKKEDLILRCPATQNPALNNTNFHWTNYYVIENFNLKWWNSKLENWRQKPISKISTNGCGGQYGRGFECGKINAKRLYWLMTTVAYIVLWSQIDCESNINDQNLRFTEQIYFNFPEVQYLVRWTTQIYKICGNVIINS